MPGSPKKKRTKRKATDSDLKALEGQTALAKRARARANAPSASILNQGADSQPPRQSGRPGAGTGGRGAQLEKLGDILHAPVRISQSKGATSLDPNTPANPLAPEPTRKGRGSRSKKKQPPPPYSPSVEPDTTTLKSRSKKNKDTVVSAPSFELNHQPIFLQQEAGGRYGFSPPIVPAGTEPDLQALNNSFVAAAKKAHALPDSHSSLSQTRVTALKISQPQVPVTTHSVQDPILSGTNSSAMLPDVNFYQNLDPALRLPVPQSIESEQSDTSKDDSSGLDESSGDEQIGWGEVHGHHSTHPGFPRECSPPQPRVVTALPTDFEFQHSRDEGDEAAENILGVVDDLSEDSSNDGTAMNQKSAPQPNDVLKLHHERNGHPRLPDPALLELLHVAEVDTSNPKAKRKRKRTSKHKSKVVDGSDDEGPKATQLGWYGPRWKSFLEDAKAECHTQQALENPFPSLVHDLPVSITESLSASLVQWLKNSQQVDAGVWPAHKPDMARLLYDDLATWRSDLKKIVISKRAAWVEVAATELLADGRFLRHGVDELGKTKNFAHPALLQAIILFYYTGSYRIAHRRPAIFRKEVPLKCLALVCTAFHCVFQGLKKNDNGKSYSKFTSKEYESIYHSMLELLDAVMKDPYHGPKLVQQLREWAKIGWAETSKLDGIDTSKHRHLHVQLD
ncbi:uncharacterized protein F5891DRAFT_1279433 [Suillus fuscotomentosus]|uniref:DUF6532 domain-containing protein n=1 Tax=Suillus fuscotomentosus TaxID=1912939 RepID=A0AAD4E2B1_9AGAM|nr:uncharacterized protein F5891DRAFT_1279433 [Suillus fuscotomentosus]KAG1898434.1 hypothetical protein F5891DRAFT_1279433 [Suillus fuscotomentosus]